MHINKRNAQNHTNNKHDDDDFYMIYNNVENILLRAEYILQISHVHNSTNNSYPINIELNYGISKL